MDLEWAETGIEGAWRFINRVWTLNSIIRAYKGAGKDGGDTAVEKLINRTIKGITGDIEKEFHFNTAIAKMMEFTNGIHGFIEQEECSKEKLADAWQRFVRLMAPFIPHICEELWETAGNGKSVFGEPWPGVKEEYLKDEEASVAVQINGKLRGRISVVSGSPEQEAIEKALNDENISKWLKDRTIVKQIYVQDKILNLVVK
jgi:leucyl-tRNA synthetase